MNTAAPSLIGAETLGECQAQELLRKIIQSTHDYIRKSGANFIESKTRHFVAEWTKIRALQKKKGMWTFGGRTLECGVCDERKYNLDFSSRTSPN